MARIYERITAALLWIAAFCFASGVFFSITLLFRSLPPTPPVAIGVVTIERYSKLKDYLGAAIFFLAVPPLTIWFRRIGAQLLEREQRRFGRRRVQRKIAGHIRRASQRLAGVAVQPGRSSIGKRGDNGIRPIAQSDYAATVD